MITRSQNRLSKGNNYYHRVLGALCLLLVAISCRPTSSTEEVATPTSTHMRMTPIPMSVSDAIQILEDPTSSGDIRAGAALDLATYGPAAVSALDALIITLQYQSSSDARWTAAKALGEIGTEAQPALPALINAWKNDPASTVRESSGQAVAQIATLPTSENLSLLIGGLSDESSFVRTTIIQTLGKMREQAKSAVPALVQIIYNDPDRGIRGHAAYALQVITNESFSEIPNDPYWEGGYKVDTEKDEAVIVLAAQRWWEETGQKQQWPEP